MTFRLRPSIMDMVCGFTGTQGKIFTISSLENIKCEYQEIMTVKYTRRKLQKEDNLKSVSHISRWFLRHIQLASSNTTEELQLRPELPSVRLSCCSDFNQEEQWITKQANKNQPSTEKSSRIQTSYECCNVQGFKEYH